MWPVTAKRYGQQQNVFVPAGRARSEYVASFVCVYVDYINARSSVRFVLAVRFCLHHCVLLVFVIVCVLCVRVRRSI